MKLFTRALYTVVIAVCLLAFALIGFIFVTSLFGIMKDNHTFALSFLMGFLFPSGLFYLREIVQDAKDNW